MKKFKFNSPAQEFIYVRTYARWVESLQRREIWPETVTRYMDFIKKHLGDKIPDKVIRKLEEAILNFQVMPSMRFLWAAGEPAEQDNTCIYNCAFAGIDSIEAFAETLYILMCGTGDGFSVEKKYVYNLPTVPERIFPNGDVHEVEDSKPGWANSVKILIGELYKGIDVDIRYNKVRPYGSRLRTMGGRASGPGPLAQLHAFIRSTFYEARGRSLTSLECHDIQCETAQIVVVGGVRRSSEISLSDLGDKEMQKAKTGNFPIRRHMANNSSIYYTKPDILTFMNEWASLIESKSGERGIFNLEAAKAMCPKRRDSSLIQGTNPCVPGNTEVLTIFGYKPIEDLVGMPTQIWNGFEWSLVFPEQTGSNCPLVTVTLSSGQQLTCTEYHKFKTSTDYFGGTDIVDAKDLEVGDKLIKVTYPVLTSGTEVPYAYTQGFISAEGMDNYTFFYVYDTKYMCIEYMSLSRIGNYLNNRVSVSPSFDKHPKSFVPFGWNLQSKLNWFAGLLDGDGTVLVEGGTQICSVDESFLIQVQKLLTILGTPSKVCKANDAGLKMMPDGRGGHREYACQTTYRLMIGSKEMQALVNLGLVCRRLKLEGFTPNRSAARFVTVVDVSSAGMADKVYCFNEPLRHLGCFEGIVTGQCGEIQLRHRQFCNLSEVVVRAGDDIDSMLEKVETATWMGVIQACFTYFPYLAPEWKNNCEEERLLGVSITGQMDSPQLFSEEALKAYKAKAIKVARKASTKMGINMPAAITCVKPSGTVSQLVDAASGLHPRFSKYYIRRYRIAAVDPLLRMIKDQGVPLSPENGQTTWTEDKVNTWVVSFPIAAPDNCVTVEDVDALAQLEWYKKIQLNWCEHNASITVYVKPEEWLTVGDWVYKNWNIVNGISFLPVSDHVYEQAPYEKITKEQYDEAIKNFPKIDYSQLSSYECEDNTTGASTPACSGGQCDLA